MRIRIIFILFIACNISYTQNCEFIHARSDELITPHKFWINDDTTSFVLMNNGTIISIKSSGDTISGQVPVPEEFVIEMVLLSYCFGDIFLIYGITDYDVGSGIVCRVDSNTLSVKWHEKIWGFNIGYPLYHKGYLYLSSIGWVGKLNVKSGKYEWIIDNLYRWKMYNSFDQPFFRSSDESIICFPERKSALSNRKESQTHILEVDNASGTIIRGAPPTNQEQ